MHARNFGELEPDETPHARDSGERVGEFFFFHTARVFCAPTVGRSLHSYIFAIFEWSRQPNVFYCFSFFHYFFFSFNERSTDGDCWTTCLPCLISVCCLYFVLFFLFFFILYIFFFCFFFFSCRIVGGNRLNGTLSFVSCDCPRTLSLSWLFLFNYAPLKSNFYKNKKKINNKNTFDGNNTRSTCKWS